MSIDLKNISNFSITTSSGSGLHNCSDSNLLLVCVGIKPDQDQEVLNLKYNNDNLAMLELAQQDNSIQTSVWYLQNPSSGDNALEITLNSDAAALITSLSYSGVNSLNPFFKTRNGVGKHVSSIPVKSFAKISGLSFGIGCVNNENAYVNSFYGNQFNVFDYTSSGNGIRMQAIAASGLSTVAELSVPNTLTEPADWSVIIVGLEAE